MALAEILTLVEIVAVPLAPIAPGPDVGQVTRLVNNRAGRVWWTGSTTGYLDDDGQPHVVVQKQLPFGAMTVSRDGQMLCGATSSGVWSTIKCLKVSGEETETAVRPNAGISSVTQTSDGLTRFTESGKDRLGWIDSDGGARELFLPPTMAIPLCMLEADDGSIWFSRPQGVTHLNGDQSTSYEASALFAQSGRSPSFSTEMVRTDDGSLWLAINSFGRSAQRNAAVVRFQPSGSFTEAASLGVFRQARCLTASPDGSIWFAEDYSYLSAAAEFLSHITPDNGIVRYQIYGGFGPYLPLTISGIAVDRSRTVWLTVGGRLERLDGSIPEN